MTRADTRRHADTGAPEPRIRHPGYSDPGNLAWIGNGGGMAGFAGARTLRIRNRLGRARALLDLPWRTASILPAAARAAPNTRTQHSLSVQMKCCRFLLNGGTGSEARCA